MASCTYCKADSASGAKLLSCICRKASYCSKDCQVKDRKNHKKFCLSYAIRESPGKGRGLFATRSIKAGDVIMEEYPLITLDEDVLLEINPTKFKKNEYLNIDKDSKAKILKLHDPAENIKALDSKKVQELIRENPILDFFREAFSDEACTILRILSDNCISVCGVSSLYHRSSDVGLYNNISRINHSCNPNAVSSWVMGDFKKKQIRAIKNI